MAEESHIFSDEELNNIEGLCEVLAAIRARLLREGISIEDIRKRIQEKEEQENTQA